MKWIRKPLIIGDANNPGIGIRVSIYSKQNVHLCHGCVL